MLARVLSCATVGVDAYTVEIEVSLEPGLPMFITVGLPDAAVKESRDRVTTALKNAGFAYPAKKIVVNLAPADTRKEGSGFDLPVAIGILAASGQLSTERLSDWMIAGELSLDGSVRPIRGALPLAVGARAAGCKGFVLPVENAREAAVVEGLSVYPVASLAEAVALLNGERAADPLHIDLDLLFADDGSDALVDFAEVRGQEGTKRAIEVAAAGGHNILLIGPPGSGKTMLAKRLPTILPPLTLDEALETTKVHSIAGLLPSGASLLTTRPFRSPHHTISDAGLVGGGSNPKPGEVSLAHHGVLFLDELPEFRRQVLEVMRQPLEDGKVTISRATISVDYPANFMLAAAMNPCPCGYFTDPGRNCSCTPPQIQRYLSRVSGPLLDRIDIHIEAPPVAYKELSSKAPGENSQAIRARVIRARDIQRERYKAKKHLFKNADLSGSMIRQVCVLDSAGEGLLRMAINKLGLSARAYDRILKVSRTIADLADSDSIRPEHLSEAIQYRSLDRNLWS